MIKIAVASTCIAIGALGMPVYAEQCSAKSPAHTLALVELYTSEGCDSCPPADKWLRSIPTIRGANGVVPLSLHVDYWDYIGWKDPFASPHISHRQRAYGRSLDQRFIFTPQMVIDGATQSTGTDRARIGRLIEEAAARRGGPRLVPRIERNAAGNMVVAIPSGHYSSRAAVWLAVFDPSHLTAIKRGENRGKMLKNVNVVREFKRIGTWRGEALTIPLPDAPAGTGRVVIVQHDEAGQIFGAAVTRP